MAWDQARGRGRRELDLETFPEAGAERGFVELRNGRAPAWCGAELQADQPGGGWKGGPSGLRVSADFRSTRKGLLRPLVIGDFKQFGLSERCIET